MVSAWCGIRAPVTAGPADCSAERSPISRQTSPRSSSVPHSSSNVGSAGRGCGAGRVLALWRTSTSSRWGCGLRLRAHRWHLRRDDVAVRVEYPRIPAACPRPWRRRCWRPGRPRWTRWDQLGLTTGATILVNGAGGGVGLVFIRLVFARGLRVLGTGSPSSASRPWLLITRS
jgi:hypothetical protein